MGAAPAGMAQKGDEPRRTGRECSPKPSQTAKEEYALSLFETTLEGSELADGVA